ncbi:glycosyltransferase family 4 protein [Plantactinospora sp. ZYX-F-223]|uniref:glycosyltransferase family 4 protein n=1 Tax=Plantactinospora sp. ZYX-F-223 TaxID=3144103 RepID=UPI0031FE1B22
MHILITAVGQRTEHWIDLFTLLCARPELTLTIVAADVSAETDQTLRTLAREAPRLHYHPVPHLLGEARTGHMASVLFRPRHLRQVVPARPDVLHVIGEAAYLSTWQALGVRRRRWPRVPVTLYAAQNIVTRFPTPFPQLERRAFGTVTHAFPITPAALGVLRAKGYRGAATVVPLGVDTRLFAPAPRPRRGQPFTVGFVGRLEPHKGVTDLLQAVDLADADLLAVGRGSLAAAVTRAAARRPGRVRLHDWADHAALPGLLRGMDVLVLPSIEIVQRNVLPWVGIPLREQFGRVLVEAMACGVPVVGSDVGEIPHIIGEAGLTYPAGNVLALADRLTRLRDDAGLAARLRERGLRRAAAFGWDRAADTMCEIWQRLRWSRRADNPARCSAPRPAMANMSDPDTGKARAS